VYVCRRIGVQPPHRALGRVERDQHAVKIQGCVVIQQEHPVVVCGRTSRPGRRCLTLERYLRGRQSPLGARVRRGSPLLRTDVTPGAVE
jgi:hypothetical protein